MRVLEFIDVLKRHPRSSIPQLMKLCQRGKSPIRRFLAQVEVSETQGKSKDTGRWVTLYEISLPPSKRKAVGKEVNDVDRNGG